VAIILLDLFGIYINLYKEDLILIDQDLGLEETKNVVWRYLGVRGVSFFKKE
jgi:hypothetical protein